jgi:glycosyltransferase involved in cell wall biosynthesis
LIADKFEEVLHTEKIDILESPEYNADGLIIKRNFPDIPLIVRLHTPTFLIYDIIWSQTPFLKRIRKILQDKLHHHRSSNNKIEIHSDEEEICKYAEAKHSPSESLASICAKKWNLDQQIVKVIPYVFDPAPTLLEIPIGAESKQRIFYFGRLEIRKGIYIFEKVIPIVLKKYPEAEFHFIGQIKTGFSGESFKDYLIRKCKKYTKNLYFRQVSYADIPQEMKTADICLFPSQESLVCQGSHQHRFSLNQ